MHLSLSPSVSISVNTCLPHFSLHVCLFSHPLCPSFLHLPLSVSLSLILSTFLSLSRLPPPPSLSLSLSLSLLKHLSFDVPTMEGLHNERLGVVVYRDQGSSLPCSTDTCCWYKQPSIQHSTLSIFSSFSYSSFISAGVRRC